MERKVDAKSELNYTEYTLFSTHTAGVGGGVSGGGITGVERQHTVGVTVIK